MPFGFWAWMGPKIHVGLLDEGPDPPWKWAIFGKRAPTAKVYGRSAVSCAKNGWTDRDAVWVIDSGGPKEECIRWGPDLPSKEAIIRGKDMLGHTRRHSAVSCAKTAEPIDLPFGLWTQLGRRKHKFNRICPVAPMYPSLGRTHWCHMANKIKPPVCGGDAALRQITLDTCCCDCCQATGRSCSSTLHLFDKTVSEMILEKQTSLRLKNYWISILCSFMSAVGTTGVQTIGNDRKSWVMGHVGHGSVHWWVRLIVGHKMRWIWCTITVVPGANRREMCLFIATGSRRRVWRAEGPRDARFAKDCGSNDAVDLIRHFASDGQLSLRRRQRSGTLSSERTSFGLMDAECGI